VTPPDNEAPNQPDANSPRVPAALTFAAAAAPVALEAGALIYDYFKRGVATEYKGDADLVTVADRASEKLIVERMHSIFPDHGIYGEEGTRKQLHSEYRWYIDPLDGTTNFAHGFPVFCVSMGLEHRPAGLPEDQDGTLIAAVIYDPTRDELFTAERGKGAYLNGMPIHVSPTPTLSQSLIATGFPSRKRHANPNVFFYQEFTLRSHGVRRAGSAAIDLAYVACGRFDAYWEFNLNPWDTTAGVLLVIEAGGTLTRFDGSPFRIDSREILATNAILRDEMIRIFDDMFAGRNLEPLLTPQQFAAQRAAHS
jgi:myo-inositol-1(or 4)-monophosphatase